MADAPLLETRSISKSFGPVEALNDVSVRIHAGRVHTLLGENGAGKSTLMKILAGVHRPARGSILLDSVETVLASPDDAQRRGIAIVYQELSLANNLSVAENIYANHQPHRFGVVNRRRLMSQARELLAGLRISLDPAAPAGSLSMAQAQLVEIAKALSHPARVIIMDEPTSSLGHREAEELFEIIGRLKAQGKAIVYISHRMDEIMRISDEISVMRDGRLLTTLNRQDTTIDELIALMVGREMRDVYAPRALARPEAKPQAPPLLEVRRLMPAGNAPAASFSVNAGEVLGLFGLVGAGRSELMKALFGVRRATGEVFVDGAPLPLGSPAAAIARGIAFVTENRKEQGLVLRHSVAGNVNMVYPQRGGARFGLLGREAAARRTRDAVARMSIRAAGPEQTVADLSGGNQQKIVFAKWLDLGMRIFLLDEPTRGIDVGARYEIYGIIRELAASGAAVILVSSDLPEVLAMSDRLLVMRERRIVKELATAGLSQEEVIAYATGAIAA